MASGIAWTVTVEKIARYVALENTATMIRVSDHIAEAAREINRPLVEAVLEYAKQRGKPGYPNYSVECDLRDNMINIARKLKGE